MVFYQNKKVRRGKMANFLSLTIVFHGSSLNYGESIGNITGLKRVSFKGKSYSYISRQALRYDIVRIMNEEFGMKLTPVGSDGKVVQFEASATIEDYPEIDLFGYMKTSGSGSKGKIRKAIVRLSDAVSLEPWNNDLDYGNNMGLSARNQQLDNMIFQTEIHQAFYSYTITIELDNVGQDKNDNINLTKEEKIQRVILLLDSIKLLYRDIKGRREDLSPLIIIGGIYESGNPFFYNKATLLYGKDNIKIKPEAINDTLHKTYLNNKKVSDTTFLGYVDGIFDNINSINIDGDDKKLNIEDFFKKIKEELTNIYR
jgi:CRISPR-associated protein Cst2